MTHDDERDDALGDELVSAEERAEAEALALAMERGHGAGEGLDVAAMIRFAANPAALGDERADAILSDVFNEARPVRPVAEGRGFRWLFAPILGVAAALVLFYVLNPNDVFTGPTAALPAPSNALLEAQARVAAGGATTELSEPMREHRRSLYRALEEAYLP